MIIRRAQVTDIPTMCNIYQQTFPEKHTDYGLVSFLRNTMLDMLSNSNAMVAELDGEILGFIGAGSRTKLVSRIIMADTFVEETHKRKGIGTKLLEAYSNEYPDFKLIATIHRNNEESLGFYKAMGFTLEDDSSYIHSYTKIL